MLWCSLIELDALLSVIMLIIYGLIGLRNKQVYLGDVFFFCRLFPLLFVVSEGEGFYLDTINTDNNTGVLSSLLQVGNVLSNPSIDVLLAVLLFFIMHSFSSFESVLLLVFAFIGQYYMLHSMDLMTFYIALEAQNFCFLVLCGLPGVSGRNSCFNVEASLKYFLLSAFSSGVILFWFSAIYLQTGLSVLSFKSIHADYDTSLHSFQILCAMMFKLGAAPLHLWVIQIYNGVKRNLLMYISTAPKLSLFGFWVGSFQTVWTDYSLLLFSAFSIALGAFGAYSAPTLRSLFAFSTVNEIGLLLSALETAGFHSLFQHLGIYIISQLLLWNLSDKRLFTLLAVSLAGLPPLAGFFGKAWIFWHVSTVGLYSLLALSLFCAAISLVYYLRVLRIFWDSSKKTHTRIIQYDSLRLVSSKLSSALYAPSYGNSLVPAVSTRFRGTTQLTAACVVLLIVLPLFLIKPFVL